MNYQEYLNIIDQSDHLEEIGSWNETEHHWQKEAVLAIISAVASKRPLLIQGAPGTGKSQLAHAAAKLLKRVFLSEVIQAETEVSQLLWSIDYTQRLADAQMASLDKEHAKRVGEIENYIGAGSLWWAIDWQTASNQKSKHNFVPPRIYYPQNTSKTPIENGVVLLIDEIDKADISLANGLLEVLGNRSFHVPSLGKTVTCKTDSVEPLIVLTSNGTRQLPSALLRRCVVLELKLPEDLENYFVTIGETHYPTMQKEVLTLAARQIIKDREDCRGYIKTGLAEYLDLLTALIAISDKDGESNSSESDIVELQKEWLEILSSYFYKSNAEIK